jgi:DNA polymerase-1
VPAAGRRQCCCGAGNAGQGGLFAAAPVEYETVLTDKQLDQWIAAINAAELTAVDTETTSLDRCRPSWSASRCAAAGRAAYIPVAHSYQDAPQQLSREHVLAG